jgi:hypothetical protein
MKQEAVHYLKVCLEENIKYIVKQDKDCEIDPMKINYSEESELIPSRIKLLECNKVFNFFFEKKN